MKYTACDLCRRPEEGKLKVTRLSDPDVNEYYQVGQEFQEMIIDKLGELCGYREELCSDCWSYLMTAVSESIEGAIIDRMGLFSIERQTKDAGTKRKRAARKS